MKNLDAAAVSYQLILTKTDYLKPAEIARAVAAAEAVARKHGAAHPTVLPTSSETGFGIARAAEIMDDGARRGRLLERAESYAASWKMMPSVKRSPLRRLETPWRMRCDASRACPSPAAG